MSWESLRKRARELRWLLFLNLVLGTAIGYVIAEVAHR
jgi:hypothetical protein